MSFKIDTKEKFTVVTPQIDTLDANMATSLQSTIKNAATNGNVSNIVLNLQQVTQIDTAIAQTIAMLQSEFYENSNSFVTCCINKTVEKTFETADLLDGLNYTPTESEAWDIIQFDEIEKELLD